MCLRHGEAALPFPAPGPRVGRGWRAVTDADGVAASFGQLPLEDRFIAAGARRALLAGDDFTSLPATVTLGGRLLDNAAGKRWPRDGLPSSGSGVPGTLRRLARGPDPEPPGGASREDSDASRVPQTAAQPTFQTERSIRPRVELAVTYDQNGRDGLGSQLQRIYGLYALSRALDLKYVHTPLGHVDYQGLMPLLDRAHRPGLGQPAPMPSFRCRPTTSISRVASALSPPIRT